MEEPSKNPQADSETEKPWETKMDDYKREIKRLDGGSDDATLATGDVLIRAREVFKGHGNWIRWMEDNLPFSVRQAQRRIKAAKFRAANATLVSHWGCLPHICIFLPDLTAGMLNPFLMSPIPLKRAGM